MVEIREKLNQQLKRIQDGMVENRALMNQNQPGDWREVEEGIIKKARIVCTTLSMSGIDKLDILKGAFEYLIIDEACQSTEPSTLIPFSMGARRVILVGD